MASEALTQQQIMLALADIGALPYRNNVGACVDESGRQIRYGLANSSAQMNAEIKSSDIIAVIPTQVYIQGTGWTIVGIIAAIEVKHPGWHMTPGDKRARAQLRFHDIIRSAGGYAGFATSVADALRIIHRDQP